MCVTSQIRFNNFNIVYLKKFDIRRMETIKKLNQDNKVITDLQFSVQCRTLDAYLCYHMNVFDEIPKIHAERKQLLLKLQDKLQLSLWD